MKTFNSSLCSRRHALWSLSALALTAGKATAADTGESIVVTMFGGASERAFMTALVEPFQRTTGIKIVPKLGAPSEWLTSAMVNKARPEIDLLWLPLPEAVRAISNDLVGTLSEDRIPNLKAIRPKLREIYEGKGVAHEYAPFGIGYRTDLVKEPPKSWAELFDPKFAGQIALPDILSNGVWELLMMATRINGGDESNLEPGFATVQKIKGSVKRFYKSQSEAANLLDSGEVPIVGVLNDFRVYALQDTGKKVGFILPSEGAVPSLVSFHIAKNTAKASACEKFIDFALSVEGQTALCNDLICGPSRPGVTLNSKAASKVPPFEKIVIFDWRKVYPQNRRYVELWNRTIAN